MKIRNLSLTHAFVIFSLLLSLAALLFAFQASRIMQESISRMSQTPEFVKQSKLDIWYVTPKQMVSVDTCFDAKTNLYVLDTKPRTRFCSRIWAEKQFPW